MFKEISYGINDEILVQPKIVGFQKLRDKMKNRNVNRKV